MVHEHPPPSRAPRAPGRLPQLSLLRVGDGGAIKSVADLVATVEDVSGAGNVLMVGSLLLGWGGVQVGRRRRPDPALQPSCGVADVARTVAASLVSSLAPPAPLPQVRFFEGELSLTGAKAGASGDPQKRLQTLLGGLVDVPQIM